MRERERKKERERERKREREREQGKGRYDAEECIQRDCPPIALAQNINLSTNQDGWQIFETAVGNVSKQCI